MAQAGFVWTGIGVSIQCFSCPLVFNEVLSDSDIWGVHARAFPECDFLKLKKGESWIKLAQEVDWIDCDEDEYSSDDVEDEIRERELKKKNVISIRDKPSTCLICFDNRIEVALL